jgi:hypothetical protein
VTQEVGNLGVLDARMFEEEPHSRSRDAEYVVDNNFPGSNVFGTLRVPPPNGTRSVPDTFIPPQVLTDL